MPHSEASSLAQRTHAHSAEPSPLTATGVNNYQLLRLRSGSDTASFASSAVAVRGGGSDTASSYAAMRRGVSDADAAARATSRHVGTRSHATAPAYASVASALQPEHSLAGPRVPTRAAPSRSASSRRCQVTTGYDKLTAGYDKLTNASRGDYVDTAAPLAHSTTLAPRRHGERASVARRSRTASIASGGTGAHTASPSASSAGRSERRAGYDGIASLM